MDLEPPPDLRSDLSAALMSGALASLGRGSHVGLLGRGGDSRLTPVSADVRSNGAEFKQKVAAVTAAGWVSAPRRRCR